MQLNLKAFYQSCVDYYPSPYSHWLSESFWQTQDLWCHCNKLPSNTNSCSTTCSNFCSTIHTKATTLSILESCFFPTSLSRLICQYLPLCIPKAFFQEPFSLFYCFGFFFSLFCPCSYSPYQKMQWLWEQIEEVRQVRIQANPKKALKIDLELHLLVRSTNEHEKTFSREENKKSLFLQYLNGKWFRNESARTRKAFLNLNFCPNSWTIIPMVQGETIVHRLVFPTCCLLLATKRKNKKAPLVDPTALVFVWTVYPQTHELFIFLDYTKKCFSLSSISGLLTFHFLKTEQKLNEIVANTQTKAISISETMKEKEKEKKEEEKSASDLFAIEENFPVVSFRFRKPETEQKETTEDLKRKSDSKKFQTLSELCAYFGTLLQRSLVHNSALDSLEKKKRKKTKKVIITRFSCSICANKNSEIRWCFVLNLYFCSVCAQNEFVHFHQFL